MEFLIKLGFFLLLVGIGYWRGRRNERRHLEWLETEEKRLARVRVFATRYPPPSSVTLDPILVTGSVVLASDYFRLFMAGLRKLVGGNYRAYETLLERGRRHAMVRMKAAALDKGAALIFNVRLTTSRISNSNRNENTQVEVLAYGTAFIPARGSVAETRVEYEKPDPLPDTEMFSLLKNRTSAVWVLTWLALVGYCFFGLVSDDYLDHSWRYVTGAPWGLFWGVGALLMVPVFIYAGRKGIPWAERIVLSMLTLPALVCSLYFLGLQLNGLGYSGEAPIPYVFDQQKFELRPVEPGGLPALDLEDEAPEYWHTREEGEAVKLLVVRGPLGFYQYDLRPLKSVYQDFYRAERRRELDEIDEETAGEGNVEQDE